MFKSHFNALVMGSRFAVEISKLAACADILPPHVGADGLANVGGECWRTVVLSGALCDPAGHRWVYSPVWYNSQAHRRIHSPFTLNEI
jgi:hypothetical protein